MKEWTKLSYVLNNPKILFFFNTNTAVLLVVFPVSYKKDTI